MLLKSEGRAEEPLCRRREGTEGPADARARDAWGRRVGVEAGNRRCGRVELRQRDSKMLAVRGGVEAGLAVRRKKAGMEETRGKGKTGAQGKIWLQRTRWHGCGGKRDRAEEERKALRKWFRASPRTGARPLAEETRVGKRLGLKGARRVRGLTPCCRCCVEGFGLTQACWRL
ncbi:hypothetical protein ERJ75_001547000 [Trypanosoma vivax]|nr:hypothetical protein ERJ75_001547000 [Trypanosoma vivax]